MQRYLVQALNRIGIEAQVTGYYTGVAKYYERNIKVINDLDLNGYLFDFAHLKDSVDKRSSFVGLFETLFLEQGGSVKKYEKTDKEILLFLKKSS